MRIIILFKNDPGSWNVKPAEFEGNVICVVSIIRRIRNDSNTKIKRCIIISKNVTKWSLPIDSLCNLYARLNNSNIPMLVWYWKQDRGIFHPVDVVCTGRYFYYLNRFNLIFRREGRIYRFLIFIYLFFYSFILYIHKKSYLCLIKLRITIYQLNLIN